MVAVSALAETAAMVTLTLTQGACAANNDSEGMWHATHHPPAMVAALSLLKLLRASCNLYRGDED